MNPDSIIEQGEGLDSIRKKEKDQVRDFIERLVNVMLGENVDDAPITRLYNDKQYLPISGQSPCTAHAALKQLIERLLKETSNLSNLQKVQENPAVPLDDTNRTYEDLLATAIINKVISSCQNNLPTSSANSVSSRVSTSSRHKDEKEYFFGEETLESKWKTTDLDTTSVSSLEEWIKTESRIGSRKYVDKVTLMIKQDIEEVVQSDSENEQDDAEYFRTSSSLFNDDDDTNWYLQKRQFRGTHSPVPVPMLVPKPTTETKVLIGDKEVDETSDLSDAASDFGEDETISNRHNFLIESKTIIGGKNTIPMADGVGEESGASSDSGVKEFDEVDSKTFGESLRETSKADITVDDDNVEDSSLLSVYSNTEKEAEYTEKYGSLPRTILKSPTPAFRHLLDNNNSNSKPKNIKENYSSLEDPSNYKPVEDLLEVEFVGNYSKREKEKWKHAVEMKNNPYSKENIEKRIRRSSSSTSSLYGSDYYARQASKPAGAKVKSSEINGINWPPKTSYKESNQTNGFHQAVPAVVTPDHENEDVFKPDNHEPIKPEIKTAPPLISSSDIAPSELTSDSDVSYVNFYDVTNSQVSRKSKDDYKPIEALSPALYGSYKMSSDENSNDVFVEENNVPYATEEELIQVVPVAKPRKTEINNGDSHKTPLYTKAPPPVKQRTIIPQKPVSVMKRNKSDSDILTEDLDKPFTVLHKRKDNTIISKIYSSMNVRNFALGQRQHLPESQRPVLTSQISLDSKLVQINPKQGNFDDGHVSDNSSKTGRMSFFSSEEDMLSLNSNSSYKKGEEHLFEPKIRGKKYSVSSEDGVLSGRYPAPHRKTSTSKHIYSSSEDLLSIDEAKTIPKRKDNTLISKIYLDPNVRNFALHNRDYIPDETSVRKDQQEDRDVNKTISHENHVELDHLEIPKIDSRDFSDLSSAEISLEYINDHDEHHGQMENGKKEEDSADWRSETPDPDIGEVAKKRLVRNILGQFSKSQSCISVFSRTSSIEEDRPHISVKDLKKRFENYDAKSELVSSLTARSLSKQMKESLRE